MKWFVLAVASFCLGRGLYFFLTRDSNESVAEWEFIKKLIGKK